MMPLVDTHDTDMSGRNAPNKQGHPEKGVILA